MYSCKICNYNTNDSSNYKRHMQSEKHNLSVKNKTRINNNIYVCQKCNKEYNYKNIYNKHIITCTANNLELDNQTTIIQTLPDNTNNINNNNRIQELENKLALIENENKLKDKIIHDLINENKKKDDIIQNLNNIITDNNSKLLEEKDTKIDIMHDEVEYLKSVCKKSSNLVSETMSTVNFIIHNLTSAPPIDKNMDYKKIIYQNKDKMDILDELVHHFRHKSLPKYIGDIIVKCYKKEDPNEQSIWNSDIARKNYLLREIINKETEWITDKKGVKTTKIIIEPIIKIIENLIRNFLKDDRSMNKDGTINKEILEKRLNIGIELNEILLSIDHKTLHNEINGYIAQFFYFNKNEYTNATIKLPKKIGRPKTIKSSKITDL